MVATLHCSYCITIITSIWEMVNCVLPYVNGFECPAAVDYMYVIRVHFNATGYSDQLQWVENRGHECTLLPATYYISTTGHFYWYLVFKSLSGIKLHVAIVPLCKISLLLLSELRACYEVYDSGD